jgi:two-component system OmpR family sensor kinase
VTARLVLTAVALVAAVAVAVGLSATLAMRSYLDGRLDGQVQDALRRAAVPRPSLGPVDGGGTAQFRFVQAGSLGVQATGTSADGYVAARDVTAGSTGIQALPKQAVARLMRVPQDGRGHTLTVSGHRYRVMSATDSSGTTDVVGLRTDDVDETLANMRSWFALLTLAGVLAAGLGGTALVRRQLRPLHAVADAAREVTTQDLSSGETEIVTRVPATLTDDDTEVGQVGAALNTLLDHVNDALGARHRSEQQVRQFVADASHELRTPLATIRGYAELARRTPDDAAHLSTALGKVETETDRMSALVEDLLLLARLDTGRPLADKEVDVTRVLLEAVGDARVIAPGHHWRLDLPDEPVAGRGDPGRLHQVVSNLLGNARTHTPAGTTVLVSAAGGGGLPVEIRVHDDGPGLPSDLVPHAFERFTRADVSRTRSSGGAGLGLSLVAAIVAAQGGSVHLVSGPGSTTFTVRLPAAT